MWKIPVQNSILVLQIEHLQVRLVCLVVRIVIATIVRPTAAKPIAILVAATQPAQSNVVVATATIAVTSIARRRPIRVHQVYARQVRRRVAAMVLHRVVAVRAAEAHRRVLHAVVEDRKRYFMSNKISI